MDIIQLMKKYNFTENETKAYISLLQYSNMSGYEVSKQSGIPRSKIYNILEILLNKGAILSTQSQPIKYSAVPVDEFIAQLKISTSLDFENMENSLGEFNIQSKNPELWKINSYSNALTKLKLMLRQATSEVYIQIWENEIDNEILALLVAIEKKADKFILICFSENQHYNLPLKKYYKHGFEHAKIQEDNGRWLSAVIDNQVLFGSNINSDYDFVWTYNSTMVFLTKEFIIHDAYTAHILEKLGDYGKEVFGDDYAKVRDIY